MASSMDVRIAREKTEPSTGEAIEARAQAFIHWMNHSLKSKSIVVSNLTEDLQSGTVLINLLQCLSPGKNMPGRYYSKPLIKIQKIQNLTVALRFIADVEKISTVAIKPSDILEGNQTAILNLLWSLIVHYRYGYKQETSALQDTFFGLRRKLLMWINCFLPDIKVTNLSSDWSDGKVLLALVNFLAPNYPLNPVSSSFTNIQNAMDAAESELGIPQLVEAGSISESKSDERAMILYLSYFVPYGQNRFEEWVKKQLPGSRLENFSQDWTDGSLLARLVNSVSGGQFESYSGSTLATSMNAAQHLLGILKTETDEQFNNSSLDGLSRLSYLSQFYRSSIVGTTSAPIPTAPDKVVMGQVQIPRNIDGKSKVWLEVDCSDAGFGTLTGTVDGKDTGSIPVTIQPLAANDAERNYYHVFFTPPRADIYTFSILYENKHIPGSPRVVNLYPPDPSKVKHIETSKVSDDDDSVVMTFDTADAGQGKLKANAVGEIGGSVPIRVSLEPNGTYILTFAPPFPDIFKVDVLWGKFSANAIGESCGLVPLEVCQDDKHECSVTFKPPTADVYTVDVNWDGKPVPGSPFTIDLLPPCSPEDVECALPIYSLPGEEAELLVDASGAGSGNLTANCTGKEAGEVPVQMNSLGGRAYQVTFTPPQPDLYTLNVMYGDKHIKGSPFEIDMRPGVEPETGEIEIDVIPDPTKCLVSESPIESVVLVNRPIVFTVDTNNAGASELVIEVDGPTPAAVTAVERPYKKGTYDISFRPSASGSYSINVLWSNKPIPGAPLEVKAIDYGNVESYAYGKPVGFDIDADCKSGDLDVYAIHNDSGTKYKAKISKISKGKYKLTFNPKDPGLYFIHVAAKGSPIRGSPFTVYYSIPLKPDACRVDGFSSICYVNYPMKFLVDASDAGLGEISIRPTGPKSKKDKYHLSVSDNKDFTYSAKYTPQAAGSHNLTVLWGGKQIPGSPFITTAKEFDVITNIYKVEDLHTKSQREEKVNFFDEVITIPTHKAVLVNFKLSEDLQLKEERVTSEVHGQKSGKILPEINKHRDGTYNIIFNPSEPDSYDMMVHINEMTLPRMPMKVVVQDEPEISPPPVEEVMEVQEQPEEESIPHALPPKADLPPSKKEPKEIDIEVGNELKLKIRPQTDAQRQGKLVAHVNGKETGPGKLKINQTDEGIFVVRFNPTEPDHYVIDMELNGQRVPSSPFYINYYSKPVSDQNLELDVTDGSLDSLSAMCMGNEQGEIPVQIIETSPGSRKFKLKIRPEKEDLYKVYVKNNGTEIRGSPFVIDLRKPNKELSMEPEDHVDSKLEQDLEQLPPCDIDEDEAEEFTPQDAPLAEFTQYIGKTLNVKIRPESEAQRNGEVVANVVGAKTGEALAKVHKLPDETFIVEFQPDVPDKYTVTIKLNNEDVPHTPFIVNYVMPKTDPSKCKLIGVDEISHPSEVGSEISLLVDASNAGPGELNVTSMETMEAKTKSALKILPRSGEKSKYNVYYTPNSHGYHNLAFTWANKPIPQSPISFLAVDTENVTLFPYGKPVSPEFNIDGKDLKLKIVYKGTGTIIKGKLSKIQKGKYKASFTPKEPGLYYLHIYSKDKEIPSSPYVVKYGRPAYPDKCEVIGLEESCFLGESVEFGVDSKEAGDGDLKVSVVGPDKKNLGEVATTDNKDGTHAVAFTPKKAGDHKINVTWSDKPVPGSPHKVKVRDMANEQLITKLFLVNRIGNRKMIDFPHKGILETTTDQKALMTVKMRTTEQKNGKFSAVATNTATQEKVPVAVVRESDTYFVSLQPSSPSTYSLSARLNEEEIPGSPLSLKYTKPPPVASECRIIGLEDHPPTFMVGKNIFFQVDTRLAGDGKVSIKGESPRGKPALEAAANPVDSRLIDVTYVPNVPGSHKVSVAWSGEEIPKSPAHFQVEPIPVYPNGKPVSFEFEEEAKESDLHCLVFHEESGNRLKGKINKLAKNKFGVSFKPRVPGLYSINVYVKMREIKNSPFYVRYAAPPKPDAVVVRDVPEEAYIKEPYRFSVDTRDAGISQLKVKVTPPKKGKEGTLSVVDHKDGIYSVDHTPEVVGNHVFSVVWDKKSIPQSPVSVSVGKRVPVVKSSLGSNTNIVPVGNTLTIDVDNVGKHESKDFVRAAVKPHKSGSKDAPIVKKTEGKHSVEFTPTVADDYILNLFMHESEVEGSPFLIKAVDKECLSPKFERSADYLPSDVECGKPVTLVLPWGEDFTDENTDVAVAGPEGPCRVEVTSELESSRGIGFVPSAPGDYIVGVAKDAGRDEVGAFKVHAREKKSDAQLVVLTPASLEKVKEPIPVGETEEFDVDTSKAGYGRLKARQTGPGKGKMALRDKGNDIYGLSITPTAAGACELDVLMNDESINDSPFTLQFKPSLPRPEKCTLEDVTESAVVNTPITFTVNAKEAGSGTLSLSVSVPREKPGEEQPTVKVNDNGDQTYAVEYVPNVVGDHRFDVKWSDQSVPGSPFTVPVSDDLISEIFGSLPSMPIEDVVVPEPEQPVEESIPVDILEEPDLESAPPLKEPDISPKREPKEIEVEVGTPLKLKVRPQTDAQRDGKLTATVQGVKTGSGQVYVNQTEEGVFEIKFNPSEPDHYIINVELNGEKVPSSPFYVHYYQHDFGTGIPVVEDMIKEELAPPICLLQSIPDDDDDSSEIVPQDAPLEEFTQYIGRSLNVRIRPETDEQRNGTVLASAIGEKTGDGDVKISQLPDEAFLVYFNPEKPDLYSISVKLNGQDVPHTPFKVRYVMPKTDSSKCKLIGKGDISHPVEVGSEISLLVDAVDAGPGELDVTCHPKDSASHSNLMVRPRSGEKSKYEISYIPSTTGYHHLDFTWAGKLIPESPVEFLAIDTENVELFYYGKPVAADFNIEGKDLKLKIVHKDTGKIIKGKLSKVHKGKYKATFSPTEPGLYYLHVYSKDKEIPSSPYVVKYGMPIKPEKCKVIGMDASCYLGEDLNFIVDAKEAGDGSLTVTAIGPSKKPTGKVTLTDKKDGMHSVKVTPETAGNLNINILWGEKTIPGSPFPVKVKNISDEQLITKAFLINRAGARNHIDLPGSNDQLKTTTDQTLLLSVKTRTNEQRNGKFSATVTNDQTDKMEPLRTEMENDTFLTFFQPSTAGQYTLTAKLNEDIISETPLHMEYTIPPPDSSKCKIIGLEDHPTAFSVGKPISFQVDTRLAGDGEFSIKAHCPRGKPDMEAIPNSLDERLVDVKYNPNVPGSHQVSVLWSGEEIPQSPLNFQVEPIPVYPNGKPIAFDFDVAAKESDLHSLVFQEETGVRLKSKVHKIAKNKFSINFKPRVPGLYSINVYTKMKEIMNSPFYVRYAPPPKPEAVKILDIPNEVYKNEPYAFTVDAKDAGISHLKVKVNPPKKSKSGEVNVTDHRDGIYTVQHIPHASGKHSFDITWDKKPVPETPLIIDVQHRAIPTLGSRSTITESKSSLASSIEPQDVVVKQDDAISVVSTELLQSSPPRDEEKRPRVLSVPSSTIVLGESADVDIDVKDIPRGALKVNQSGDGKAGVQFKKKSEGIITCTVTPTEMGTCTLNFLFNDKSIEGSPCTLNYYGLSGVDLEGEKMQVGVLHKFSVGCSTIHDGLLEVFCGDDDFFAADISTKYSEDDRTYNCTIVPKEAGSNTISVKYNGHHIIGSPFNVEFIPQEPSNLSLNLATPTGMEHSGLSANIMTAVGNQELPVTLSQLLGGQYSIDFVPTQESEYVLTIKCNLRIKREEKEIADRFNLSYTTTPVYATDCTVEGDGIQTGEVGLWSSFTVKAKDEEGDLSVMFDDANSIASGPLIKTITPSLEYEVKYLVKKSGNFRITLNWNGKAIPGSPFDVACVVPDNTIPAEVEDFSTTIVEGNPLQFTFKPVSETPGGELQVSAYSQAVGVVMGSHERTSEGKYNCTVHLEHQGRYLVQVTWDNQPLEGTPFEVDIVEPPHPEKVKVYGPGLKSTAVGERGDFIIDTTEAGHGNISVNVTGPEGQFLVDLKQDSEKEKIFHASYLPQQAGRYTIDVTWGGLQLPDSPFIVDI